MKALFISLFLVYSSFAVSAAIECRFGAFTPTGEMELDEAVFFPILPGARDEADFDSFNFKLSISGPTFQIRIRYLNETINKLILPIENILALPVGVSIFGLNIVDQIPGTDFKSIQYECVKVAP